MGVQGLIGLDVDRSSIRRLLDLSLEALKSPNRLRGPLDAGAFVMGADKAQDASPPRGAIDDMTSRLCVITF